MTPKPSWALLLNLGNLSWDLGKLWSVEQLPERQGEPLAPGKAGNKRVCEGDLASAELSSKFPDFEGLGMSMEFSEPQREKLGICAPGIWGLGRMMGAVGFCRVQSSPPNSQINSQIPKGWDRPRNFQSQREKIIGIYALGTREFCVCEGGVCIFREWEY